MHAILNESAPPRTQAGSGNLKFTCRQKLRSFRRLLLDLKAPLLQLLLFLIRNNQNGYAIGFPLLPGMTRYAIHYRVALSKSIVFHPRLSYPTSQFSVIFPQSIKFTALEPDGFPRGKNGFHRIIDREGVWVQVIS